MKNIKLFSVIFIILTGCCFQNYAQQLNTVDFQNIKAEVFPEKSDRKITGNLTVSFRIKKDTDSVFLDARNMTVEPGTDKAVQIAAGREKIWLLGDFKSGKNYSVSFSYTAFPGQALYFFDDQIWTQGQGKYTSHWLPSIDDTNDKIEFDITVITAAGQTAVANGILKSAETRAGKTIWKFEMDKPMSSYLTALAIGNFKKQIRYAASGIPIEIYYKPEDSSKVEATYRYSREIFDFLERETGYPYPWQVYKMVPLRDFLYAGMENTSATFFSEAFMVDSIGFHDRDFVNVNAHELAHQWFGNLVTAKDDSHHWLQEGFATYYAWLAEKEIFGEDYFYWQLLQAAEQLIDASEKGKGESLLNPKAGSLTFYQKGAWALHILREKTGDLAFRKAVQKYLKKNEFGLVETDDFLKEIEAVSDVDTEEFKNNWLLQTAFQQEEVFKSLMGSEFIKRYFETASLREVPLKDKSDYLKSMLSSADEFIGQEIIFQLEGEDFHQARPLWEKALKTENIYIRQAVASMMNPVFEEFKEEYRNLIHDASYFTKELVMYRIWNQFPENRAEILNLTSDLTGFQNKNIRQLWLTLALLTENYKTEQRELFREELKAYCSPVYSFEIRQRAFEHLFFLGLWDFETLKNLTESAVHPNWRFAKFAREMLRELAEQPELYAELSELKETLHGETENALNKILKK